MLGNIPVAHGHVVRRIEFLVFIEFVLLARHIYEHWRAISKVSQARLVREELAGLTIHFEHDGFGHVHLVEFDGIRVLYQLNRFVIVRLIGRIIDVAMRCCCDGDGDRSKRMLEKFARFLSRLGAIQFHEGG